MWSVDSQYTQVAGHKSPIRSIHDREEYLKTSIVCFGMAYSSIRNLSKLLANLFSWLGWQSQLTWAAIMARKVSDSGLHKWFLVWQTPKCLTWDMGGSADCRVACLGQYLIWLGTAPWTDSDRVWAMRTHIMTNHAAEQQNRLNRQNTQAEHNRTQSMHVVRLLATPCISQQCK